MYRYKYTSIVKNSNKSYLKIFNYYNNILLTWEYFLLYNTYIKLRLLKGDDDMELNQLIDDYGSNAFTDEVMKERIPKSI